MEIERRLYHYGLGLGVPYRALNSIANAVDVARNAGEHGQRQRLAREMLAGSPWAGFISKDRAGWRKGRCSPQRSFRVRTPE